MTLFVNIFTYEVLYCQCRVYQSGTLLLFFQWIRRLQLTQSTLVGGSDGYFPFHATSILISSEPSTKFRPHRHQCPWLFVCYFRSYMLLYCGVLDIESFYVLWVLVCYILDITFSWLISMSSIFKYVWLNILPIIRKRIWKCCQIWIWYITLQMEQMIICESMQMVW